MTQTLSANKPAKSIQMGSTLVDNQTVYIIAEMACAHDGDYEKAKQLVDIAYDAKVNAVQFQLFHAPENMVRHHPIYGLLEKIEFSRDQWSDLVSYARAKKMDVFSCAYDMPSLEFSIQLKVDGIKFNSADLNNFEMIECVAKSGIPFTLGTGASRMDEIGHAISVALNAGGDKFVLMHGMQSFPTSLALANIRKIQSLSATFGTLVGYADHTDGEDPFSMDIDLLALGMGGAVFEKHYTIDRSLKGTDYQAALNPAELIAYVQKMRKASIALGSAMNKPFNADEIKYRTFQKKQIVAAHDLRQGTILTRKNIALLRTEDNGGLDASYLYEIIGKKLASNLNEQQLISINHFEK